MKFFYLLIGILFVLSSFAISAQESDYLKFFPKDTIAVMSINNVKALQQKIQQHAFGKFWSDKAVQKFMEKPLEQFKQQILKPQNLDFQSFLDGLEIAQGQIILALIDVKGDAGDVDDFQVVFMMDTGDKADKMKNLLQKAKDQIQKSGLLTMEKDFMGGKIVYFKKSPQKTKTQAHQEIVSKLCYCMKNNLFLCSLGDAGLKQVLQAMHSLPTPEGLLNNDIYRNALSQCKVDGSDYTLFVNGLRIVQLIKKQLKDEELKTADKILHILGLNNLQALMLNGNMYDKDMTVGNIFILAPGQRRGLLKILSNENQSALLPTIVPEDVANYFAVSFSPTVIWQVLMELLDNAPAEEKQQALQQIQDSEEQLQFSFGKDFIPTLGNELRIYKDYVTPFTKHSERVIISLSLRDATKFQTCLDKLLALAPPDANIQKEAYMGVTLYTLEAMTDPDTQSTPVFCVYNNQLLFSNKRSGIEKAVRISNQGKGTLASAESYKNLLTYVPGFKNMVHYNNPGVQIEYLKVTFQELFETAMNNTGLKEQTKDWVDWKLIPPAEVFKKYFATQEISALTVLPQGFLLKTYIKLP